MQEQDSNLRCDLRGEDLKCLLAVNAAQIGESEQSDTDVDEDESMERTDSASTDEDDVVFYDAMELARSGSLGSIGRAESLDEAPSQNGTVEPAKPPAETW